ncbi:MAG: lipoate--protein ligase family protein [Gemmatimonadaceae bacterium]
MRWRLLLTPPGGGIDNMALDSALMERARVTGEGVVRVYSWSGPTLSLGRNQRARGFYSPALARERAVCVVRRITGGRALLHHREITYSVTAPASPEQSLREAYSALNDALLATLRRLGVLAHFATVTARSPSPSIAPCFHTPAAGELVFEGRKLAGSAQVREGGAMLQHGSILVHDDQPMLDALSSLPLGEIPPAATLSQALPLAPTPGIFAEALFGVVRERWDQGARELAAHDVPAPALHSARVMYADDDWTWRR